MGCAADLLSFTVLHCLANSCNLFVSEMGIDTALAELTLPLTL